MIQRVRHRFFTVHYEYTDQIEALRARGVLRITWVFIVATLGWVLAAIVPDVIAGVASVPLLVSLVFGLLVVVLLLYRLIQNGRIKVATWFFTALITVFTLFPIAANLYDNLTVLIAIPLVAAGVLLDRRGLVLLMVFVGFVISLGAWSNWGPAKSC